MTRTRPFLLMLATLAFGLSPLLTPDFGGFEPNQFPIPQTNPPVQPAGYAFSIWAIIYLWLFVASTFQLARRYNDPVWEPLRLPLTLSVAIGAIWLMVAFVSPVSATLLIWLMWFGAIVALLRAPDFDRAWAEGPIGLYAGWLTAASCVALGLVAAGYGLMADGAAALCALALALALALGTLWARPLAWSFAASFIWALVAVIVRNGTERADISAVAAGAIGVVIVWLWLQWRGVEAVQRG
ncbi:hypothetical protein ACS3SW_01405 [Roseobacteraceae bacterium S113]